MLSKNITRVAMAALLFSPAYVQAEEITMDKDGMHMHHGHHQHQNHDNHGPQNYAPAGVMGDHMHEEGEWMLSYRFMHMNMEGNRIGTNSVSPDTIATTIPNRFSGMPMQPPTLRVVPTEMDMNMHMLGAMYAPTDWLTLMGMVNYIDKEMDHITYSGGMGTTVLGTFSTETSGFGDTKLSGLVRVYEDDTHHVHLNVGLSLPTGSIDETDTVLAPTGMTPTLRLPYAMQLGTGTFDALPGITYTGQHGQWAWGAQYSAEVRLESENDEGYAHGDKHAVTTWGAYGWTDQVSTSLRLSASTQDSIDGIDPNIMAPVQTADPDNYGGEIIDLGIGVNFLGQSGYLEGHKLGLEVSVPLYRDLNGPQMETDLSVTAGWSYYF